MKKSKIQTSWQLEKVFGFHSERDLEKRKKETVKANQRFVSKWKSRADYLEKPEILLEALIDYEKLHRLYGSEGGVGFYYSMKSEENEEDPKVRAAYNIVQDWSTKVLNEIQFFELSLSKIFKTQQAVFLNDERLKDYKHFLERIFSFGAHTLSDSEERVMNLKHTTSHEQWTKMTSSLLAAETAEVIDEKGRMSRKNFEELRTLNTSRNKEVREMAHKAYLAILARWLKPGTAEINAVLEDKRVNDELRSYKTPDASRMLSDDIDASMVTSLISAVSEHVSISHEYFRLKAKILGVKKLTYNERLIELGSSDISFSFNEAYEIVKSVFEKLDPFFAVTFENFFANGQVDVFPKKGKRGGAFCAHNSPKQPTIVLLNFNKRFRDVSTLAHEFGHAINNVLIQKTQNSLNARMPISTAEVASTFMEDFVFEELEKRLPEKERLGVLMNKLQEDVMSIFYCIAMYKFEAELHSEYRKRRHLASREIGDIYKKHMKWWIGSAVTMDPGNENIWLSIPHVRYFFYVYSYASGTLISKALQRNVRQDHSYMEKVKEFLSAGTSKSPKDIFKGIGVDISKKDFWNKGLAEMKDFLAEAKRLA